MLGRGDCFLCRACDAAGSNRQADGFQKTRDLVLGDDAFAAIIRKG